MKTTKLFYFVLSFFLCTGFSCSDDINTLLPGITKPPGNDKTAKKYLSKITVTNNRTVKSVDFKYNEDNTLAKYSIVTTDNEEHLICSFSYDGTQRLSETKRYFENKLSETHTYKYLGDNTVEVSVIVAGSTVHPKPYIYTLNDKGFPVRSIREESTFEIGSSIIGYSKIKKEYFYNTDNTLSKLKIADSYMESMEYNIYAFTYEEDTFNPFNNLPSGNFYLYDNALFEKDVPITGIGSLVANCSTFELEATALTRTTYPEKYIMTYEYGDDKFPVKARMETHLRFEKIETCDFKFEYITKRTDSK